jgi:xylose dehydrogenase (NAD/NADP)
VPEPVRIGVVGGRSWIANAAVIPAIMASEVAALGSVGSRSGPLSYDDVLADDYNDAVYIALPNGMHLEWVQRAAAAGKHVLCEKPLSGSVEEISAMAAACESAGVLLAEAYMTPFHPRSALIADLLASGGLGEIRHVEAAFTFALRDPDNYRWLPEQGGGALLDVGIYALTPVIGALGAMPDHVDATVVMAPSGVDLTMSTHLGWAAGASASVVVSFELPERQWLHIAGTGGALSVERAFTPGPNDVGVSIARPDGSVERITTDGGNCYEGMIDSFAAAVAGRATWPRPVAEAFAIGALCERIAHVSRVRSASQ